MNYKLMIVLALAFLTSIFIIQNAAEIDVRFLVWSVRMSHVLLMAAIFVAGILLGWLLSSYLRLRSRHKAKHHEIETASNPVDSGTATKPVVQSTSAPETEKDASDTH